jgi:hypothetical protein
VRTRHKAAKLHVSPLSLGFGRAHYRANRQRYIVQAAVRTRGAGGDRGTGVRVLCDFCRERIPAWIAESGPDRFLEFDTARTRC